MKTDISLKCETYNSGNIKVQHHTELSIISSYKYIYADIDWFPSALQFFLL